ncbi:MAG: phosphatase PAP2 family protein [Elusimicrobia bacterium]|nr:phosphatase PAP2 family protein [Elusimicrobiota bacterium]
MTGLTLDQRLFLAVNQGWSRPLLDPLMLMITQWTDYFLPLALLLFFRARAREQGRPEALLVISSILCAVAVAFALKALFDTPRPLKALAELAQAGKIELRVLGKPLYERGLPSSHTLRMFSLSAAFWPVHRSISLLLLVPACLVGLSRIYVGAHFPSDVAAGAFFGAITGLLVCAAVTRWAARRRPRP